MSIYILLRYIKSKGAKIRPSGRLESGWNISPTVLFINDAIGQWGLLARYAVVALKLEGARSFPSPLSSQNPQSTGPVHLHYGPRAQSTPSVHLPSPPLVRIATPSQPWIHWFAFQRQHAKRAFMNAIERFTTHKSLQSFEPQGKFTQRQRSFC